MSEGKRFRIIVDEQICQGHSVCMAEAPEIFEVDEETGMYPIARLRVGTIGEDLLEKARTAERYCPNRAIRIEDL